MNPFDTLSAAAAILQLTEQGWKVASKAVEIYRNEKGTTQELLDFVDLCEKYMRLGAWTEARAWSATGRLSQGETSLRDAAVESRKAAASLLDVLMSLKVDGSWKAWNSLRLALKSSRVRQRIQLLVKSLQEQRMQLLLELQGVMFDRQQNMTSHMEELLAYHRNAILPRGPVSDLSESPKHDVTMLSDSSALVTPAYTCTSDPDNNATESYTTFAALTSATPTSKEPGPHLEPGTVAATTDWLALAAHEEEAGRSHAVDTDVEAIRRGIVASLQGKQVSQSLLDRLGAFLKDPREVKARQQILRSLRFDCRLDRHDRIKEAHESTYEWMFDADASDLSGNFLQWIQTDAGLFWISGKAGCGKSTLMKFISGHRKMDAALMRWANGRRLFVASYYFWNPGTEMQKSQRGLLQSIIHNILHQVPTLVQQVCPWRWDLDNDFLDRGRPWTLSELRRCVKQLVKCQLTQDGKQLPVCFCLFIDGLDEYEAGGNEGDHDEVISLIQSLTKSGSFKICVSSRPWPVFIDAFQDITASGRRIEMHDLTKGDVLCYCKDTLRPHLEKLSFSGETEALKLKASLAAEIAEKAEGVFLWVYLVVQELIRGIRHQDTVQDLRDRLTEVPPRLEDYFAYMFRRADDKVHRRKAARVFLVCGRSQRPIPLAAVTMLDRTYTLSEVTAMDHTVRDTDWLTPDQMERYKRRIYGLCGDLLEVRKSIVHLSRPLALVTTIDFLHRTVKDFIDAEEVKKMLSDRAGKRYDATNTLCLMYLFLLKKWHPFAAVAGHITDWPGDFLDYARELESRSRQDVIEMLRAFYEVMHDGVNDNPAMASTTDPNKYQDLDSFVAMLNMEGIYVSVEELAPGSVGPSGPRPRASQHILEREESYVPEGDVQIREVRVEDVRVSDLVMPEVNKPQAVPGTALTWLSWLLGRDSASERASTSAHNREAFLEAYQESMEARRRGR